MTHGAAAPVAHRRSRLGRAKVALQSLVASEAAQAHWIALQRFPQTDGLLPILNTHPSCDRGGWHSTHIELFGPGDVHSLEAEFVADRPLQRWRVQARW